MGRGKSKTLLPTVLVMDSHILIHKYHHNLKGWYTVICYEPIKTFTRDLLGKYDSLHDDHWLMTHIINHEHYMQR